MDGLMSTTALSPFLSWTNIQFAWDSTSLSYLKTCPRLYQYVMIDGWGQGDESIHLRFGQEYHKALEDYERYKAQGIPHEESLRQVVRDLHARTWDWSVDETTRAGKYKNKRSLMRAAIWYLEKYRDDPAETFILENGKPAVELSFRFELDWGPKAGEVYKSPSYGNDSESLEPGQPYLLSGHLDKVVNFGDNLYVMDHKTTTTTPGDYFFDQFEPNNQMTLYTLASQVILKSPVKGVIIDAAQMLTDDCRFVRGFTYRTADQLEEWVYDLQHWLRLAESYAEQNYWPMNDLSCDKYGGCKFRGICSKSPQVRERFLAGSFKKLPEEERWNPLRPR